MFDKIARLGLDFHRQAGAATAPADDMFLLCEMSFTSVLQILLQKILLLLI